MESPRKRLAWHLCLSRVSSPCGFQPTLGCLVPKGCLEPGLDLGFPGLWTPKKQEIDQLWRGQAVSLQGLIRRLKNDCSPKDSLARVLRMLSGAHQAALIAFPTGATTEAQKSQIQLCPGLCSFLSDIPSLIPGGRDHLCILFQRGKGLLGSIPGLGRYPGEGYGKPLQYSCLENPMDRGTWQVIPGRSPWGHKESDMTEMT